MASTCSCGVLKPARMVSMATWVAPRSPPCLDPLAPHVLAEVEDADPGVDAEALRVAAVVAQVALEPLEVAAHLIVRQAPGGHPAVAEAGSAFQHRLGNATEPDGDGALHGEGQDAGVVDVVVVGLVRHQRLRPQLAQYLDLLLDLPSAGAEILAQGVVLDVVPADADAQPQSSGAQHVHRGRLLGDEGGLPLRQNQNAGDEFQLRGDGGEKAEQHHGFVKRMGVGVGAGEAGQAVRVSAKHVVVDEQIVVAEFLGGLGVILDGLRVVAVLRLRKYHAVLHALPSPCGG